MCLRIVCLGVCLCVWARVCLCWCENTDEQDTLSKVDFYVLLSYDSVCVCLDDSVCRSFFVRISLFVSNSVRLCTCINV